MSLLRIYISIPPSGGIVHASEFQTKTLDGWKEFYVDVDVPGYVGPEPPQALRHVAREVGS